MTDFEIYAKQHRLRAEKDAAQRLAEKRLAALKTADACINKANRMVVLGTIAGFLIGLFVRGWL